MGFFDWIEDKVERLEDFVIDDIPEAFEKANDKVADFFDM